MCKWHETLKNDILLLHTQKENKKPKVLRLTHLMFSLKQKLHLNMLKCRKGQQARWYGDEIGVCHLYSFIFYCSKFKAWRQKSKHLTRHFLYVVEPPKLSVLSAFDTTRKRIALHFVSYFWRFHHIDCLSFQRYCQSFLLLKYSLAETNRGDLVKQLFQQLFKKNFQVCKMHGKMLRWPFATLPVLRHFFSSVGFSFTTTFTRRHHAISAIYLLWNIKPYKKTGHQMWNASPERCLQRNSRCFCYYNNGNDSVTNKGPIWGCYCSPREH